MHPKKRRERARIRDDFEIMAKWLDMPEPKPDEDKLKPIFVEPSLARQWAASLRRAQQLI